MIEIKPLASGSRGNCYLVTDGVTPLLLECGIPYRDIRRGLNFRTAGLVACLVSHEHKDHCKAVADVMKAGIDVFASAGTIGALGLAGHRVKAVRAREQFTVGSWTILPFDTVHDAAEPLGFLLASSTGGKLLYATDTAYLRYRFRGLTHIMVEANYSMDILRANVETGTVPVELKNRIIKSHFGLENVKDFFRANDLSRVQEIWLLHLSDGNSDAERFKREIMELTGKLVRIA
ncbi:MAG: MBL fold metallo-hydrolase [Thermoanaerobacter sp.]|nr:MBL fold metallo-hydrolase [Thermoanaerobacter sp.]